MKTINQTLTADDSLLGNWTMWTNDVMNRLDALRITPKPRINVAYEEVEYTSTNGWEWECTHPTTYPDAIEQYDEYMDAVTGVPQPLGYKTVEVCAGCDAWYDFADEEWRNV